MEEQEGNKKGTDIIQFGSWIVTDEGIYCTIKNGYDYFVGKDELNIRRKGSDNTYDWLLQLSGKTWITELDLYQLNTAYFFALDYFGIERLSDSKTILEQVMVFRDSRAPDDSDESELIM